MIQVNIHDAKTRLSQLIRQVEAGEEVIIARAGQPVARLVAVRVGEQGRRFGAMAGRARVDERFFEPLPDDELSAWS